MVMKITKPVFVYTLSGYGNKRELMFDPMEEKYIGLNDEQMTKAFFIAVENFHNKYSEVLKQQERRSAMVNLPTQIDVEGVAGPLVGSKMLGNFLKSDRWKIVFNTITKQLLIKPRRNLPELSGWYLVNEGRGTTYYLQYNATTDTAIFFQKDGTRKDFHNIFDNNTYERIDFPTFV